MKFYLLWSFMLLLKLLFSWQLQLFGDEAFYAWEADRPAWAYSDLPGMTAWLIRAGIEVAGHTPFAARMAFVSIGAALPFLVIRIARYFSSEAHAWQAGMLGCCLPLLLPVGILALPEAPLCLAALLCLDAALRLLEKCDTRDCLQLALGLAIGACTHYRFAIILLAGGLGFIFSGGGRQLRNPKLLLALLLGACAWLPLLLYNEQHDFAGWQFQFQERNPWQFSARGGMHLPIQAILVTPILYAFLLWCLWRVFSSWRAGEKKLGMILGAAGLPIVLFAGLAFFVDRERTSFHWPLQAYLPLMALLPRFLSEKYPSAHARAYRLVCFSALTGVAIACAYFLTAILPGMADRLVGKKAYPDNFVAWREVSVATRELLREDEILVADNFMLAAQLHFAFGQERQVYVLEHPLNHKHGRARQLLDWSVDETALSKREKNSPVLIVLEETATKEWLRDKWRAKLCDRFDGLKFEKIVYGPGNGKSFSIFRARLGTDPTKRCDTRIPAPGDRALRKN